MNISDRDDPIGVLRVLNGNSREENSGGKAKPGSTTTPATHTQKPHQGYSTAASPRSATTFFASSRIKSRRFKRPFRWSLDRNLSVLSLRFLSFNRPIPSKSDFEKRVRLAG